MRLTPQERLQFLKRCVNGWTYAVRRMFRKRHDGSSYKRRCKHAIKALRDHRKQLADPCLNSVTGQH